MICIVKLSNNHEDMREISGWIIAADMADARRQSRTIGVFDWHVMRVAEILDDKYGDNPSPGKYVIYSEQGNPEYTMLVS